MPRNNNPEITTELIPAVAEENSEFTMELIPLEDEKIREILQKDPVIWLKYEQHIKNNQSIQHGRQSQRSRFKKILSLFIEFNENVNFEIGPSQPIHQNKISTNQDVDIENDFPYQHLIDEDLEAIPSDQTSNNVDVDLDMPAANDVLCIDPIKLLYGLGGVLLISAAIKCAGDLVQNFHETPETIPFLPSIILAIYGITFAVAGYIAQTIVKSDNSSATEKKMTRNTSGISFLNLFQPQKEVLISERSLLLEPRRTL